MASFLWAWCSQHRRINHPLKCRKCREGTPGVPRKGSCSEAIVISSERCELEMDCARPGTEAGNPGSLLGPGLSDSGRSRAGKPAEKAQAVRTHSLSDGLEAKLTTTPHLSPVSGYSRCPAEVESGAPRCCPLERWTAPRRGPFRAGACAVAATSRPWATKTVMSLAVAAPSLHPRPQLGVRAT